MDGFESCVPGTESSLAAKRGRSLACRFDQRLAGQWQTLARPQPVVHLTDLTESAYMVLGMSESVVDLYATEVMVCGLEGEGQDQLELEGEGNQVLWAGTHLNDPISNSDQAMRDRILHTQASSCPPETSPHGHGEELWQEQGQGEEEDDQHGPHGGEVRLGEDSRSRSPGREVLRSAMLRSPRGQALEASPAPTSLQCGRGAPSAGSGCRTPQPTELMG